MMISDAPRSRTWLITGISGGLGQALALAALAEGDHVAGTSRSAEAARNFDAIEPGRSFGIPLNAGNPALAGKIVDTARQRAGNRLDLVVNNSGYALSGAVESCSNAEIIDQFNANLFGPIALIRASMPCLIESRGRILNISSLAAHECYPGLGMYCASKAALSAISETTDLEVSGFGVRSIAIEPGGMRTAFAGSNLKKARNRLARYARRDAMQDEAFARSDGNQTGDVAQIARAIIVITRLENPPARITLGTDSLNRIESRLNWKIAEYRRFHAISEAP